MAVAIVVGIAAFTERLQLSIVANSNQFLAADQRFEPALGRHSRNNGCKKQIAVGIAQRRDRRFSIDVERWRKYSVGSRSKRRRLAYPLRGRIKNGAGAPFGPVSEVLTQGPSSWRDVGGCTPMLPQLNIAIGDRVEIGATTLRVCSGIGQRAGWRRQLRKFRTQSVDGAHRSRGDANCPAGQSRAV